MHTSYFIFIVIIHFKYKSCSLLSRLKNRYEYLPQENIVDNSTEDLYDFEFITVETTLKTSAYKTVIEINSAEKDYRISPSKPNRKQIEESSFTKNVNKKLRLYANEQFLLSRATKKTSLFTTFKKIYSTEEEDFYHIAQDHSNHIQINDIPNIKFQNENQSFFYARPTLNITSYKSTKRWPTNFPFHIRDTLVTYDYFLRKPLLRKLEIGETKTTKVIERNSVNSRTTISVSNPHKYYTNILKYIFNATSSSTTTTEIFTNNWSSEDITTTLNSSASTTSDGFPFEDLLKNETISYCYRCGLNESRIPTDFCYNTFEGGDRRFGTRSHLFKMKCIRSDKVSEVKNVAYGPSYRKGCFKRFLDVGTEYNERGCRHDVPVRGKSFASIRFARMEYLLKNVEDGCVFSPHASITPFSRAVSLFVRYHVCVCSQKYCNRAYTIKHSLNALFIVTMFFLL